MRYIFYALVLIAAVAAICWKAPDLFVPKCPKCGHFWQRYHECGVQTGKIR